MNKILLIEDEESVLDVLSAYLTGAGFDVETASRGRRGLELFDAEPFDLVILDLMLPDIPGEEICEHIRKTSAAYVYMLTAKSSLEDRIQGLELGADEYLVKPFSPKELLARVQNLFKRINVAQQNPSALSFDSGALVIEPDRREVRVHDELISLTPVEFDILLTLAQNKGNVMSREQLIEKVLGVEFEGVDRTIDVHIKNIRKKIEDDTKNPRYVLTSFKQGYKFGGDL
ncbi:Phosphate regulon transcriptional regulatory protein PhoB (SphR) [Clostridiaceae bacterium JG1575]|nr:Phosphate regulon transcriptional regulatory protein PhoB (SphR) [Clostridiaceae bacterium JG1575]